MWKAHFAADGDEPKHLVEILDIVGEDRELCVRELGHLAPSMGVNSTMSSVQNECPVGMLFRHLPRGPLKTDGPEVVRWLAGAFCGSSGLATTKMLYLLCLKK